MTPDDINFLEWGFKAAVGLVFTAGWWMWGRLVTVVAKTKDDLADHKLHTSENYAKKVDLQPIYTCLANIQDDIKELLGRKRRNEE